MDLLGEQPERAIADPEGEPEALPGRPRWRARRSVSAP